MSQGRSWPHDYVWVYEAVVDERLVDERLVDGLVKESTNYAEAPNYWLPRDAVEGGSDKAQSYADLVIQALKPIIADKLPENWSGAEWWVQVYNKGKGLAFHFDKDEAQMKEQNEMRHPALSSVLYLTGQKQDTPRQGPTVVLKQFFDAEERCLIPENPKNSVLCLPVKGNYCLFNGGLGHGVLESASKCQRATMLINWWTAKPKGIECICPSDFSRYGFSRLDSERHTLSCKGQDQPETPQPVKYPTVNLPPTEPSQILIDDLVTACNLQISGENGIAAVGLNHQGHVLYPVDVSDDGCAELNICAAVIPYESSSESEGG